MMGGVSPETCWASYKYGIIKLWYIIASCWIFLYELHYDAWIHDHQIPVFFLYCLILKTMWLRSFDTLRTNPQTTELDTPEDLHLQQHCGENLMSHGTLLLMESAGILQKFWWSFSCNSFLNQRKVTTCHCLIFYLLSLRYAIKEKTTQCVNILCISFFWIKHACKIFIKQRNWKLKVNGKTLFVAWCVFSARVLVMFQHLLPTSIKCVLSLQCSVVCAVPAGEQDVSSRCTMCDFSFL
jgi:hypothetical protein